MQTFGLSHGARLLDAATQEKALKLLGELTQRAAVDPTIRNTALRILNSAGCNSREDACELEAIFNAVKHGDPAVRPLHKGFKYVADPRFADYFASPVDVVHNCAKGACGGDCLPSETLVLAAGFQFKAIGDLKVGDTIMGDGQWTRVTAFWDKGEQNIIEFKLNNGSVLRCTPDHKLFRVPKQHGHAGDRREAEEVRAGDVQLEDDLLVPQEFVSGNESLDAERAWLLGLFIADGWVEASKADGRPLRAAFSGLDGHRKEANKARVEAFYAALGLSTQWATKYLRVNDADEAAFFAACGHRAVNKHVPSLNFTQDTVKSLLSGLAADADQRNGVFSTVSPTLALQLRVLHRMLGQSVHISRVDEHGGLGSQPIYRVTPRALDDKRRKFARVKGIASGQRTHTVDIEVEGHRFYLPESDLVVHNCDEHSALIAALLASIGWKVGLRAYGLAGSGGFSHVYAVAAFPKKPHQNGGTKLTWDKVVGLDTTVPSSRVAWEPPRGNVLTAWLE